MEIRLLLPISLVLASLTGCAQEGQTIYTPMGDSAPEFGSSENLKSVGAFVNGRWAPEEGFKGSVDLSKYWEFSEDGTFYYSQNESDNRVTGTWVENSTGIKLRYEKYNEKTINEARTHFQKEAESGSTASIASELAMDGLFNELEGLNYIELSEDGKKLVIQSSKGSGYGLVFSKSLLRLEEVKK